MRLMSPIWPVLGLYIEAPFHCVLQVALSVRQV
jgi:hypothetical protein